MTSSLAHMRRRAFTRGACALAVTTITVLSVSGCGGHDASVVPPTQAAMGPASGAIADPSMSAGTQSVAVPTAATAAAAVEAPAAIAMSAGTETNRYGSTVMSDGPIAYYQLADGSSTLADSGTHRLSGTYGSSVRHNASAITTAASTATEFPGGASYNPNGYAWTGTSSLLQPTSALTVEAWIKLSAANTTSHELPIAVYGTIAHGVRYGLFLHGLTHGNSALLFEQRNSGRAAEMLLGGTRLVVGPIYHVVATFDGSTITTYVNGNVESRASYPGRIDYSSVEDGLQIGGGHQIPAYASASFPGEISQVAVYGKALSGSDVSNHFLAGQLVPFVSERAAWSDAFVDSIGVNAHFENSGLAYARSFATVKNLLVASGIRHLREAMVFNEPWYLANMRALGDAGIHASYLVPSTATQSQVQSFPSQVSPSFEAFEGLNEPDIDHNPNWVADTKAAQSNLYRWVKSDSRIAGYHVFGPSLTGMGSANALGNISSIEDEGNMHNYFGVYNPGTGGWGGYYPPFGVYGTIGFNLNIARVQSGAKPIVSTETGYGTIAGDAHALDYRTDLRYITRLPFEQFNAGVARSYIYEFLDAGGSNVFNNFGLVTSSLSPKPSYTGLASLISALRDPGSTYNPGNLSWKLDGYVNNVHHTVLGKRSGAYIIALWLEVPDWRTANNAGGDISVPNQTVSVLTQSHFGSASITTMDDNGRLSTAALPWTGNSATVSVGDKVSLITLTP